MEDLRSMAFELFKAGAIDKESLIDLLEPPMKQHLKEKLKRLEAKEEQAKQQQAAAKSAQPEKPPKEQ
jgi:hypothetical protein